MIMKKIFLSAAMMIAAVSFASAQWFVGGSVGFGHNEQGYDMFNFGGINTTDFYDEKVETTSFNIVPKFGYIFDESWMVGLGLGYSHTKIKDVAKQNMYGLNPYVRYTAWQVGRFSLAFQGDVTGYMGELKYDMGGKDKIRSASVAISPVVQFDLSCNVMLESRFNFASIGWDWSIAEHDGGAKRKNTGFGFGVDADNAFNTGDIAVGFIVKF